jgi:hypothetical protein
MTASGGAEKTDGWAVVSNRHEVRRMAPISQVLGRAKENIYALESLNGYIVCRLLR